MQEKTLELLLFFAVLPLLFDRLLVEAVQGIASLSSVGTSSCHLLNFSVFRHVLTYLRIVAIHITLILNKIDMFENHIKDDMK